MKRGFTLVELLAVIVILAIIALITIPAVMKIIDNSTTNSYRRSVDLYGKSVSQAIISYQTDMVEKGQKVNVVFDNIEPYIEYEGNDVDCKLKQIYSDKTILLTECYVDEELVSGEKNKGYSDKNYYYYTNSKKKMKLIEYIKAVEEEIKDKNINGTCTIAEDKITWNGEDITIKSNLENAMEGTLVIENNKVKSYSNLKFATEKKVETNNEVPQIIDENTTQENNESQNSDNNNNNINNNEDINTNTNTNTNTDTNTDNSVPGSCLWIETEVIVYDKKKKKKYKKKMRDVTEDDLLLVWDFDKGEFTFVKPLWIRKSDTADYYYLLKFSDGSELKIIHDHRIFNADTNTFESGIEVSIGTKTFNSNGDIVELVSRTKIDEKIEFSSIITNYHMNLFTSDILTSIKLNNLYKIENMKFVKTKLVNNSKDMFAGVNDEIYNGLRLSETNFKDYYTIAEINEFIEGIMSVNKFKK